MKKISGGGYKVFFICVGIVTNWLDLLTYPLLTLGMPLALLIVIARKNRKGAGVGFVLILSIAWGAGYGGMWLLKWLMASVVLNRDVCSEAVHQILFRSSSEFGELHFTRADVIRKNLEVMLKMPYILLLLAVFIGAGIRLFLIARHSREGHQGWRTIVRDGAPYLLIALMPFAWYYVLPNHSWIHFWFTYRNLAITVFALFCLLFFMGKTRGDEEKAGDGGESLLSS